MAQCASCGAVFEQSSERLYCGHCGARVAAGVEHLERYRTGAERFDRITVEPAYRRALQHTPGLSAILELGRPVIALAIGLAVVVAATPVVLEKGDVQNILVGGALALVWLGLAVRGVAVALTRVAAPTRRIVAIVTADRFTAGKQHYFDRDPCGRCDHRVTLTERDGATRDVYAPGSLMGEVAVGDIGVAYLRHDRLVDYRQFDVMAPPLEPGEVPRAHGCAECGGHQRFGPISDRCAFCGAALPKPDLGEFGARFRVAAASPEAHAASERRIRGGVPSLLPPIALTFAGALLAMFVVDNRDLVEELAGLSAYLLIIVALLLTPLAYGLVWLWLRSAPHRAGRRNALAVMVRTRSELVRTTNDNEEYRYFATIAAPNGVRCELQVLPPMLERVQRGQVGVAHLRGDWLAGFTPL